MSRLKSSPGVVPQRGHVQVYRQDFLLPQPRPLDRAAAQRERGCASSCRTAGANSTAAETSAGYGAALFRAAVFWEAGHLARNRRRAENPGLQAARDPAQERPRAGYRRAEKHGRHALESACRPFCVANRAMGTSGSPPRILILGGRKIVIPEKTHRGVQRSRTKRRG